MIVGYSRTFGVAAATIALVSSGNDTTQRSTYTYSGLALGAAETGRVIAVAVMSGSGGTDITSVTVGGNAATERVQSVSGNNWSQIWSLQLDSGTTGDVVVTLATDTAYNAVHVYRITGVSGAVPTDTASNLGTTSGSASLTIPSGGVGLGSCLGIGGSGPFTWTNMGDQTDINPEQPTGTAYKVGAQSAAITCETGGTSTLLALAAWGP